MVRSSTGSRSRARSQAVLWRPRRRSKSSSVPSSGCTAVWPPPARAPIAHGLPGSSARRQACCSGPCDWSCRSGGSAAGRATSKPSSAIAGTRSATPETRRASAGTALPVAPYAGPLAVDDQLQRPRERLLVDPRQRRVERRVERLVERERGDAEQRRPLGQLACQVALPGLRLALELPAPGGEPVDPGDDRVLPASSTVRSTTRQRSLPRASSGVSTHFLSPRRRLRTTPRRTSWPSAKIITTTADLVAHRPLRREPAAVDLRRDLLDLEARRPGTGHWHTLILAPPAGSCCNEPASRPPPAPAACSCTRPRSPADGWGPAPLPSSTGSPPRASPGGRSFPLGRPTPPATPYMSPSAFAAWNGLLADPGAPVTSAETASFAERHRFWAQEWVRFAGPAALEDQVRFEREWTALRAYAAARGVRLIGDLPIYVAPGGADHRFHPELFRTGLVAGAPPDALTAKGSSGGTRSTTGPRFGAAATGGGCERFRRTFELVDLVRVDHFRGFTSRTGRCPAARATARGGCWQPRPRPGGVRAARAELGQLALIARGPRRDHSARHPSAPRARLPRDGGAPVRVRSRRLPPRPTTLAFHERTSSSTPGRTISIRRGVVGAAGEDARAGVRAALDEALIAEREPHWSLIGSRFPRRRGSRRAGAGRAGLGAEARMNVPGAPAATGPGGCGAEQLTPALAARLREASEASGRLR